VKLKQAVRLLELTYPFIREGPAVPLLTALLWKSDLFGRFQHHRQHQDRSRSGLSREGGRSSLRSSSVSPALICGCVPADGEPVDQPPGTGLSYVPTNGYLHELDQVCLRKSRCILLIGHEGLKTSHQIYG